MSVKDQTLGEFARNPDGTYNGTKAMQWLYEAMTRKSISEDEIRKMWAEAQEKARAKRALEGKG